MKFRPQSARFKTRLLRGLAAAMLTSGALPCPGAPLPEADWRVGIAPKSALPQVARAIPGARDTVLAAAARTGSGGMRLLEERELDALRLGWEEFAAKAAAAASTELAKLKPELLRDRNGVIECVLLRTKPPGDITAVVLAPDFLARFAPLLGSKLLVAIPDPQTIYLFPRLASHYQNYAARVLAVYAKAACPVSREVFERDAGGLRAVGAFEGP